MRSVSLFLLPLCVLGLLLAGCGKDFSDLPTGIQTVEGKLKPAELSRVRRGTHVIEIDGDDEYYAESSVVPLRAYQGKNVTLRGTFAPNVDDSYLPVLVVDSILDVEETAEEHVLEDLTVTLQAPILWKPRKVDESVEFTMGDMGPVILTIQNEKTDELPEGGEPIVVGTKRAVRMKDALTGNEIITVQRSSTMVTVFTLSPNVEDVEPEEFASDWFDVLQSVSFQGTPGSGMGAGAASSGAGGTNTSAATGTPCGGPAGILCPSGMYCEITNFSENIGRCRAR